MDDVHRSCPRSRQARVYRRLSRSYGRENASNSVQEPGIARFDVIQHADDPAKFVLIEVYVVLPRRRRAAQRHGTLREVARQVAPTMAVPRSSIKYDNLFPSDENF